MAAEAHAKSTGGQCMICFDDLADDVYAEFRTSATAVWRPSMACCECLQVRGARLS